MKYNLENTMTYSFTCLGEKKNPNQNNTKAKQTKQEQQKQKTKLR